MVFILSIGVVPLSSPFRGCLGLSSIMTRYQTLSFNWARKDSSKVGTISLVGHDLPTVMMTPVTLRTITASNRARTAEPPLELPLPSDISPFNLSSELYSIVSGFMRNWARKDFSKVGMISLVGHDLLTVMMTPVTLRRITAFLGNVTVIFLVTVGPSWADSIG
ncbi:hypothetical protein TREMEDRAFT_65831 [Tremella mesenterica DSM 1558]|uniref:uncharacterized protein n=1 Tax=Tremella mesenterica (strain ATCC 24925 / CBS 8224 / DSM 1558 / NBRC 9311 / NRRL Y-6157 / RJB 2259-6 / UBC 559-6) TaxID=578456 RepID=UPI00032C1CE1|nr:uncharacterized protein TREMEDRAFT_65831 [Tremella mesenterica DSM 1558]EIW66220.1 hypothetical protein TREMEDRAFT_65831 [Tremella mesenterica DSM 1558]